MKKSGAKRTKVHIEKVGSNDKRTQCDHVYRSGPLFAGHRLGGASLGRCENEAMEGFVVCFEHVNKEALAMMVRQLQSENAKLKARRRMG